MRYLLIVLFAFIAYPAGADALEVETPERGVSIINLFEWSGT
jgi:hypothetical protein